MWVVGNFFLPVFGDCCRGGEYIALDLLELRSAHMQGLLLPERPGVDHVHLGMLTYGTNVELIRGFLATFLVT